MQRRKGETEIFIITSRRHVVRNLHNNESLKLKGEQCPARTFSQVVVRTAIASLCHIVKMMQKKFSCVKKIFCFIEMSFPCQESLTHGIVLSLLTRNCSKWSWYRKGYLYSLKTWNPCSTLDKHRRNKLLFNI